MSTDALAGTITVDGRVLDRVEYPESVGELRWLVTADAAALLVIGGGTKLSFGNSGGPFGYAISLGRLNRVLDYEPQDLTIAVEAGITIAQLNRELGQHNQMLPMDVPDPEHATIGGTYASGLAGSRRLGYGSLRDWVLGVETMDPQGIVTKAGGMVVKNVTGYDLARVHYGAHGAFGIVTRVNLKVLPNAAASRSIELRYASARAAHMAGLAILSSQLEPMSILVWNENGWVLSVLCEGASASIERQSADVVAAATQVAVPASSRIEDDGSVAIAPFAPVSRLDGTHAVARLAVPPSQQIDVLEHCERLDETHLVADLGSGLIYAAGPSSTEWRHGIQNAIERPVFLSLPAALKSDLDVFGGMDVPNARIVTRLKDAYDPERRFNRGRFVLGL